MTYMPTNMFSNFGELDQVTVAYKNSAAPLLSLLLISATGILGSMGYAKKPVNIL